MVTQPSAPVDDSEPPKLPTSILPWRSQIGVNALTYRFVQINDRTELVHL
jgi:hypothetical protein